ncbi:acyltransferase family protein [Sphingopyxis sp. USTB-05]|uniref:acyltransferase family protein n=1 Tax=Sphingopyxis sp. USTB-05 TaxID=2830667 RepID=UPI002078C2A6|nr:acyltransferase family protein [Sphingopyxis sp. USTB-05]USI78704.1 acyltransferase [Sphingopyxis sp. USTB-05]
MQHAKRFDIQLLRGVAVTTVVLYHAFKDVFPKGFLGVDVFFVISGFLICGMILRQLRDGRFSFVEFYVRRARRLLPASFATLLGTALLAALLLTPDEFSAFSMQLLGSLTFSANFVFATGTGYFDGGADTKPLLHIWSLSLEEQFYFVAPLLLWLTPLRARLPLMIVATIASLGLCLFLATGVPIGSIAGQTIENLAFYMLPSRAWELLIGGMAAWIMIVRPDLQIPRGVKPVLLASIILVAWIGVADVHPGWDAIIVTLATAILLLGKDDWLLQSAVAALVGRIGDWSYSLYLVHWPLFSFAYISYLGTPPLAVMIALVALAVLLAWLQYRFVEQPFLAQPRPRFVWPVIITVALLLLATSFGFRAAAVSDPDAAGVVGLSENCDRLSPGAAECRTSRAPTILLWGDSYAQHLVPGLRSIVRRGEGFEQATFPACAPLLGLVQTGHGFSRPWADSCVGFNEDVASRLNKLPSVRYVILASSYVQTFSDNQLELLVDGKIVPWKDGLAGQHLVRTIRAVQAAGKIPVIVGPTPIANFNVGACSRREKGGHIVLRRNACAVTSRDIVTKEIDRELMEIAERTGARILLPSDLFCRQGHCVTQVYGDALYRDQGHMTRAGSRYLAMQKLRAAIQ